MTDKKIEELATALGKLDIAHESVWSAADKLAPLIDRLLAEARLATREADAQHEPQLKLDLDGKVVGSYVVCTCGWDGRNRVPWSDAWREHIRSLDDLGEALALREASLIEECARIAEEQFSLGYQPHNLAAGRVIADTIRALGNHGEALALHDAALIEECTIEIAKFREGLEAQALRGHYSFQRLLGAIRALKPNAQQALERYVAKRTKELHEPMACGHPRACRVKLWSQLSDHPDDKELVDWICSACEREKPLMKATEHLIAAKEKALTEGSWDSSFLNAAYSEAKRALAAVRGQKEQKIDRTRAN